MMALPPPEKLHDLVSIFRTNAPAASSFEAFSVTKAKLAKYTKMLATAAVQSGIQTGVTVASGVATVSVGVGVASIAIFPLGAALAPWFGALAIGYKANGIFALHDLRASAAGRGNGAYACTCGKCVEHLTYVIDRKEANTAILAVGIFTAGLAIIADRLNSVRKSFQSNRPKERICRGFVAGARDGCICAIASIMMISGDWKHAEKADLDLTSEAIAIIWSSDGHERLKSKW
jgi:hypothetical protein